MFSSMTSTEIDLQAIKEDIPPNSSSEVDLRELSSEIYHSAIEKAVPSEPPSEMDLEANEDYVYSREQMLALRHSLRSFWKFRLPDDLLTMECYLNGALTAVMKNPKTSECREIMHEILYNSKIHVHIQHNAAPYIRALIDAYKELRRREIVRELFLA
ncbi:hypothetical protein KIN20_031655 [Parelaphostrongylus tenuis]|uniref:Uncharacterized protein n=1 Tax=Parelaphostrongylus tenuis TaxID=148309 RepID=A0AAD5R5U7_PARTN|nr:hypothetical protein KIN20_031655 [Parelaphostrongylus tenuis]